MVVCEGFIFKEESEDGQQKESVCAVCILCANYESDKTCLSPKSLLPKSKTGHYLSTTPRACLLSKSKTAKVASMYMSTSGPVCFHSRK
jgi:hypothetical protein